jgi:endonuclease/exonuclease/phosphatase family metal-dependent hydrolase
MSGTARLRDLLAVGLLLLCASGARGDAATGTSAELRIVAFNVLAPIWAAPAWYDADYWSNWLVPELPWEPNGTFVAVRNARFSGSLFQDLALSGSGNHAAAFEGVDRASGRPVRIYSVHFDSDSNRNRRLEIEALLAEARPDATAVDVVCGDVNEETSLGSAGTLFRAADFVDVLAVLGQREPTHPFTSSYNRSPRWAIIDHILVRNGVPVEGSVIDFGLDREEDEIARIEGNLRASGSDHYPVTATVAW